VNNDPGLEQEADNFARQAVQATGKNAMPPPSRSIHHYNHGTVQRSPLVRDIHEPLLDEFSRDTGIPRGSVTQQDPAYEAWLMVTRLNRLTTEELLETLDGVEGQGGLDQLILNSSVVSSQRYNRVMTAMLVVRQSRGAKANSQTAFATIASSGLPAAEQLAMTHFVKIPVKRSPDQRAAIAPGGAAELPNANLVREIGFEIDPGSRPAPVAPPAKAPGAPPPPPAPPPQRVPWDGRSGAPGEAAARAAMQANLFKAYDAYLTNRRAETVARLNRPRVAFDTPVNAGGGGPAPTGVVDIANQARAVLEARYATSMDAASSSAGQVSGRSVRKASAPGQNLFDASSEADRKTLTGETDLARGVAWWLFENDRPGAAGAAGSRHFATEILATHHYSAQDDPGGAFRWQVANAYAAGNSLAPNNRRQLIDYRMTTWSEADPSLSGRGFTVQSSFDPGNNRNQAELGKRWDIFKASTHESLHLRTHPIFVQAALGRGSMKEGFTEMFNIATLNDVLPRVRAGSLEPLRRAVEGALSPAKPDATLVTNAVTPTQYAEHRAQAERIRDGGTPPGDAPHVGVGEAAVRAAYFQGHVEYIGLAPDGSQLNAQPAIGVAASIRIPPGLSGLDELVRRSGVPRATIVRDNPGITDALPATAVLQGCREHWAIAGETRTKIARQHGVSEAQLVRANPDIPLNPSSSAWPDLVSGQKILIPVH
jgi:hypothetical protein